MEDRLSMIKDTEAAFHWIIDILEQAEIPYRISGGFAARMYGSVRPLADIDIEVNDSDIVRIAGLTSSYVIFGPSQYKDEQWDLPLLTLSFAGQDIDIAGLSAKICNSSTHQWEQLGCDLGDLETHTVFGRSVPVEPLSSLLAYKKRLNREVDVSDVAELERLRGV